MTPSRGEKGAALLTVLLLVAVMAVLSASALEKLRAATRLAGNALAQDQARAFMMAAENVAVGRIAALTEIDPARTTLSGGWHGRETRLPLPGGFAAIRVIDGGNCFNLNSVVAGVPPTALVARPLGIAQFAALMRTLDIPPGNAAAIADALADWIDSDSVPLPMGAEDAAYRSREPAYRTANTPVADVSELRAVAGVTAEIYDALRPWICALPVTDPSPINVNTLSPEQAPLFVMLLPDQITIDGARRMLGERPAGGYASLVDFWDKSPVDGRVVSDDVKQQVGMRTRWFAMDMTVELEGAVLAERALVDAGIAPARLVRRHWGEES